MKKGMMKKFLIKMSAFILLVLGIIIGLAILAGAILLFIYFPEGNFQKKSLVAAGLVILAIVIFLLTITLFEFLLAFLNVEAEVEEIEVEVEKIEQKLER